MIYRPKTPHNFNQVNMDKEKAATTSKQILCALPLAGLALLALALFALWGLSFCYAIAIMLAWNSVMIFFLLLGLSFLGAGFCVFACIGFYNYLFKIYFDRYPNPKFVKEKKVETEGKSHVEKKKFLTVQNVAYGVLALAVIFVIVASSLGCLDKDNWIKDKTPYAQSLGYLPDTSERTSEFSISDLSDSNNILTIKVFAEDRPVVVRYEANNTERVEITAYFLYENNYLFSTSNGQVRVSLKTAPPLTRPLDKMLAFMFTPARAEKQIIITVPLAYKDNVVIEADKIVYAK